MSAIVAARANGRPVSALPLDARGLHYGDGVFRTLLLADGRIDDRDGQLAHLAQDAARLALDLPAGLAADLAALVEGRGDGVVKLMLWRAACGRGYRPGTRVAESLALLYAPPPPPPAEGWVVRRASFVLAAQPALAGIKHLNRLEQVLAGCDWPAGIDELLLGDSAGRPVGATRGNLFWVCEGRLQTPDLSRCGVAGRMRARVLGLAAGLGVAVDLADHAWSQLGQADEAFLTNSLLGLVPVRVCDGRRLPAPGPLTARLQSALCHPGGRSAIMRR